MKNYKPLLGITGAICFLVLGIYQIQSDSNLSKTIGYSAIFFWGSLLLFVIYKKIKTKKTNN